LSEDLASCSADIAWYMSKPMKWIALWVMYGAKPAMSMSTTPEMGSLTEVRSASIGAETWAVASRNTVALGGMGGHRDRQGGDGQGDRDGTEAHDEAPGLVCGPSSLTVSASVVRSTSDEGL